MSGNSDVSDDFSGFRVAAFNGGTLSGNSATSSAFGFWITDFSSGTVSDNTSNSNSLGFLLDGEVSGGTLSGNTASSNSHDGFSAVNISGGTMSGNTATSNGEDGFDFGGSDPSSGDGFTASNTATFESNESSNNTAQGYDIEGTPQTGAVTNTGSGPTDDARCTVACSGSYACASMVVHGPGPGHGLEVACTGDGGNTCSGMEIRGEDAASVSLTCATTGSYCGQEAKVYCPTSPTTTTTTATSSPTTGRRQRADNRS